METCKHEHNQNPIQPIAIGPCMFYKRYSKRKAHSTLLWLGSIFTRGWGKSQPNDHGHWVESFLTLYSDSTVSLRDNSCEKGQVVAIVKLADVYKRLLFGERIASSSLPQYTEVPPVDTKYFCSMLAMPTSLDSKNPLVWLCFFSQHTLNKWLVAFCRSIPAEVLNDTKVVRLCQQRLKQIDRESPSLALKNHIRLFFPPHDIEPQTCVAPASCDTTGVKINTMQKRVHLNKQQPKRTQKGLRTSKSK